MTWVITFGESTSQELLIPLWVERLINSINWSPNPIETCNTIQEKVRKIIYFTQIHKGTILKSGVIWSFHLITKESRTLNPYSKIILQSHLGLINFIMAIAYPLLRSLVRFFCKLGWSSMPSFSITIFNYTLLPSSLYHLPIIKR